MISSNLGSLVAWQSVKVKHTTNSKYAVECPEGCHAPRKFLKIQFLRLNLNLAVKII